MSLAFRRGISTLIPPKVASPSVNRSCEGCLPNGPCCRFLRQAPKRSGAGGEAHGPIREIPGQVFWEEPKRHAYCSCHRVSHCGKLNPGYGQAYYFHLRHHKNNAH
ncbi:unnamed protein product [Tuber melanosporum]|uniref:(Perigord truffle) hypothetical protein n=1 Tax=Tuber melanosporum (strain Mel28) TaxID=656061 RepID=D5G8A9_TUBMM|nr:uncharacterized protein GSTUM_00002957001 [Tuber melanosporum]CAZ80752.1 unnamed protein product [Tuber melanosporum]